MNQPPPTTPRGPTARELLKIEWDYPVYAPAKKESDGSTAKVARRALSREEAIRYIAGDDPRPLLVLRECKVCNGTDEALLKGGADNERTFLLSAWFHCVKLPVDVLEEDHPFHNLFTEKQPEHLFVCSVDGTNHDPLESQTSRRELWESLRGELGRAYKKKTDSSLKRIAKLLDEMDLTDSRLNELMTRQDDILEEDGPESSKLKKLRSKIKKVQTERDELREKVAKAYRIELKEREKKEEAPEEAPAGR